jgi:ectoine hydroxylase
MRMTKEQLQFYEDEGFLLLENQFSPVEIAVMKAELPRLFDEDSPSRVVEKEGGTTRSVYGSHLVNNIFGRLTRHPRLIEPVKQIIPDEVYVYQFKINAKAAFRGDLWAWHQDYIFWRDEDGMPAPQVTSVAIFLDDVTEFNGPLFLIPGSHREGVIEVAAHDQLRAGTNGLGTYNNSPEWISNLTADLKYSLDTDKVAGLVQRYGIVAPKGKAGCALFFHGNLVHASTINISPFSRAVVIITYNSVQNVPRPVDKPRPEFLVSREASPVSPLGDDALLH